MPILTEDRIKVACLRFLKNHYKFHPRKGPTTSQFDMKGEDGIIADGQLFFTQENGKPFLVTFEATSDQIFEEVKYRPENRVLFWDSLAVSFVVAGLVYLYGHFAGHFTIKEVGWPMTLSILFFAGMLGFWLYRYFAAQHHRYRYIYAIEQFKRYHADDQWIAIADTIFPNSEDIYLAELKRQCVNNGIGLLEVSKEETVSMIIAPARRDVFDNRRRIVQFVAQRFKRSRKLGRRLADKGRNMLDQLFGRAKNSSSLQRYRRSFYKQILTCLASLLLIAIIFYRQLQERPIEYVNKRNFEKEVLAQVANGDMETLDFVLDTASLVEEGTYQSPYLEVDFTEEMEEDSIEIWLTNLDSQDQGSVYLNGKGEEYNSYDCQRLFNFTGQLYLIRYRIFPDFESARAEVGRLAKKGLEANMLWLACFRDQASEYVLYFDLLYPDQTEAANALDQFQKRLLQAGLGDRDLGLVRIEHGQ